MASASTGTASSEKLSLWGSTKDNRVWGFAFHRAWITSYLMLFGVSSSSLTRGALGIDNYTFSLVILILVLLSGAIFSKQYTKYLPTKQAIMLASTLVAGGTLCLFGVRFVPTMAAGFSVISGVATGIGSGFLILQWGQVYSAEPEGSSQVHTALAFGLAVVFYALLYAVPPVIRIFLGSLFPIASGLMLYRVHSEGIKLEQREEPLEMKESLLRIALAACLVGIVGSLISGIARMNFTKAGAKWYSFTTLPNPGAICMVLAVLITSSIIIVCIFKLKESKISVIYRWVLLFLGCGLVLAMINEADQGIPSMLGTMGRDCFELIFWVTLSSLSYRYHLNSIRVFSIGRIGWALGPLFSELLLSNVIWKLEPASATITVICALLMLVLLLTYLFILPERNIERITEIETVEEKKQRVAGFQERSKRLVERYGLTPREAEVLGYLIKGRDTLYIQDKLYISAGTVSTHRQRIYNKTGVHSRQELIDLFESIDIQDLFEEND